MKFQPHVLTDLTTNLLHSETLSYTGGLLITIVVITKKESIFSLLSTEINRLGHSVINVSKFACF